MKSVNKLRMLGIMAAIIVLFVLFVPFGVSAQEDIANGTWGSCPWRITASGELIISAGKAKDFSGLYAPWSSKSSSIKSVNIEDGVDTSNITNMSNLFSNCVHLTSLDLSGLDTSNVTDMDFMFDGCSELSRLDMSGLDTSNVTSMLGMFRWCYKLTDLEMSGWDTSSITDIEQMFFYCKSLTNLDLSKWNTSNVKTMNSTFYGCSKLQNLDLSNWNTSNVKDLGYMFYNCSELTDLNISGWDTSNVVDLECIFDGCSKLKEIQPIKVYLSSTTLNITVDESLDLSAEIEPSDATDQSLMWSSSDDNVATVDGNGKITALNPGRATIQVSTSNGKKCQCEVTVHPKPILAENVSLSSENLNMTVDDTSNLFAKVSPEKTTDKSLVWSSSNNNIASVDENGKVTALNPGTTTIKVYTLNGKEAQCLVTVKAPVSIYRLYMPINGEHLYTSDQNEKNVLTTQHGWIYEGVGWEAPPEGQGIYRLYNPGLRNHLYTSDQNEIKILTLKHGWVKDNGGRPLFYSGGNVPVYRIYNKGLNGMHHLTTDLNEYNTLPQYGWTQEGVSLYALKKFSK